MNLRAEELEIAIKNLQITPDAYAMWKDNIVTKRFLAEAELELLSMNSDTNLYGTTIETIAINRLRISAVCIKLEEVVDWKPAELQIDE